MRIILTLYLSCCVVALFAQNKVTLKAPQSEIQISKHIYGHFAEHLGRCIYDGIYVGERNSSIPNTSGVRNDVIKALKDLKIPNLRWPGGCFADTYHWKDAIGPKNERKHIENLSWGNVREDNSFGTNEFLNMCELLGAEPYLAVNMNTGTVQEAVEWVQYTNHKNGTSYLTDMREKSGREKPWNVKYWGIGNESWDCGGAMTVDHYINLYKQYATAVTSYGNTEKLFRIAVGPGSPNYAWTEAIMKNIPARRFEGVSIHHYSVINWSKKGSSSQFSDEEYFKTMQQAWRMEEMVAKNCEVMDKYDPEKRVALIVDEWGGWYDTDPNGNGQLYQQNSIRDAMIAGLSLNIFNNHADRVRMANLAQIVNVLQSVILTNKEKIILTPTYHVMEMYNVHQDATLVPLELTSNDFVINNEKIPAVSVSASKDSSGKMHISLTNIDNKNIQEIEVSLSNFKATKVSGRILTSAKVQDHNTFDNPTKVTPKPFKDASLSKGNLKVNLPPNSVVVLELVE
ncbi:MAG TPA: alpha-L-arabinofuranosidase C-terminal domain-containing protein [Cyclobacteriaceae bacterium]|nr:alpha-L-arabinofuranosidase C-terminal domain-containing protein [Cyclobacteriaceae bacterium]